MRTASSRTRRSTEGSLTNRRRPTAGAVPSMSVLASKGPSAFPSGPPADSSADPPHAARAKDKTREVVAMFTRSATSGRYASARPHQAPTNLASCKRCGGSPRMPSPATAVEVLHQANAVGCTQSTPRANCTLPLWPLGQPACTRRAWRPGIYIRRQPACRPPPDRWEFPREMRAWLAIRSRNQAPLHTTPKRIAIDASRVST